MNVPQRSVEVLIYSRPNCCLCDDAKLAIEGARRRHNLPVIVTEVDVDARPDLHARYSDQVPVIFVDGKKAFKYRIIEAEFVNRVERSLLARGIVR